MSWHPIALALLFGLLVSGTLHFVFIWPSQEPDDDEDIGVEVGLDKPTSDDLSGADGSRE